MYRGVGDTEADAECGIVYTEKQTTWVLRVHFVCKDGVDSLIDIYGMDDLDPAPTWPEWPESGFMRLRWVDDPRHEYDGWATLRTAHGGLVFAVLDSDVPTPADAGWEPFEVEQTFEDCPVSDQCATQRGGLDFTDTRDGETVRVFGGNSAPLSDFDVRAGKVVRQPNPDACAAPQQPYYQHAILWMP
jgi:hypothetical protein